MALVEGPNTINVAPGVNVFAQVEGKGKPIVLIHGFALTHDMWRNQVPYLKKHGYQVVAIDLRGFGNSDKPQKGYTYETWANDLGKVLEELESQNVTLVGFSLGGAIAMNYVTTRADPRIEKLVLVAAGGPYMSWRWKNVLTKWRCRHHYGFWDWLISLIKTEQYDDVLHQLYDSMFLGKEPKEFEWIHGMLEAGSPEALVGGLEELRDKDLRENLREIRIPTRIISGWTDGLVPFTLAGHQHRLIADSRLTRLWAGHGLFFQKVAELNRELAW